METLTLAAPAHDMSIYGLFMQAGWIVKAVMIGLLIVSIWSWAIIIDKSMAYARMRRQLARFEEHFWSGQSLEELYTGMGTKSSHSLAAMFIAAMREWKRSQDGAVRHGFAGVQMRIQKVMEVTIQKEMAKLEKRLLFLATVGSTAPFIGLFGTVWGIMNSFQAIAVSESTNLAVVAPGIAEALFATALGLLAAIPAVIFYNKFASELARHAGRMENFADEFSAIVSRQLDERA